MNEGRFPFIHRGRIINEDGTEKNVITDVVGSKITGSAMPGGGSGLLGWLSAIFRAINGKTTAIAGKMTVATAGTPGTLTDQDCGEGVTCIAASSNTGMIYVYPVAGSKEDVVPLAAGDSIFWPVGNLAALKVDSSVNGDSVYWMGAK